MNRRQLLCSFAAASSVAVPANLIIRKPIQRVRKPGIDYALAGETPDWERQNVIDLDTGLPLELDCVEVDCVDGWALCWRHVPDGRVRDPEAWNSEKVLINGRFRLELIE